jgi:hypothetical protein
MKNDVLGKSNYRKDPVGDYFARPTIFPFFGT